MPSQLLNSKFIDTLKPTSTRVEYFDTHSPGLALRVTENGVKSWVLLYRTTPNEDTKAPPRLRRLTLGRYPDLGLKAARKQADIERGKVAKGNDPAAIKQAIRRAVRTGDTIGDLAKDYISKHAKVKKRSWQDDQRMLDAEVLPRWKTRKVKELARRDVRELVERIAERGSPITANRCLALIRKMLNFAIEKDWIEANVASRIQKPGAERSRDRVLTDDEIRLVWDACAAERPAMCALMRLRLITAQRGGELAALKWSDVEGDWFTIPGSITKNKQPHRVYLTPSSKALIEGLPRIEDCDYIFPGRVGNTHCGDAKKAGRRIAARVLAKLQESDPELQAFDFRGHDLRRTASTKMAEAGISQADIAKVLNHVEGGPRATMVYNRYAYDREKRIALETWDRVLMGILERQEITATVVPFAVAT